MIYMLILKFAGTFGSGMLNFAIGLYILRQTGSALSMGIPMITGPVVALVLTPFVGFLVDTKNRRKIIITAQIATSLGLLLFAGLFKAMPQHYYPELIGLIIVLQVTDNFLSTALTASLVQLFDPEQLQQVNSLNQSVQSLAVFLAPIIGAVIYTWVPIDTFALLEIIFELLALWAVLRLRFDLTEISVPENGPVVIDAMENTARNQVTSDSALLEKESVWSNFSAGFKYMRSQKLLLALMIFTPSINFIFGAVNVGQPFLLVEVLKINDQQYGLTESGFALGMFFGGLLLSRLVLKSHPIKVSVRNIILLSVILVLTGVPALFNWTNYANTIFFFLLNLANGVILVFINTPTYTFMQKQVPVQMQGRIFSLVGTISMILMPLGTLVFGFLFDHFATSPIFINSGLVLLVFSNLFLIILQRKKLLIEDVEKK
ncbi:MFS transporter [Enterococcus timonensis]|uniref:MFS transporter n=1 Tax=Enterococcus timonensis TaxID=1852364 RepID=UPI000ACA8B60|nr:MFS transporter [Enterococcus timonensis]